MTSCPRSQARTPPQGGAASQPCQGARHTLPQLHPQLSLPCHGLHMALRKRARWPLSGHLPAAANAQPGAPFLICVPKGQEIASPAVGKNVGQAAAGHMIEGAFVGCTTNAHRSHKAQHSSESPRLPGCNKSRPCGMRACGGRCTRLPVRIVLGPAPYIVLDGPTRQGEPQDTQPGTGLSMSVCE